MEDRSLLRLIKKARLGDKEAFRKLVETKGKKIVFVATNLMGNKADGEDAAQEAVITLAKKIGSLKKAELFDAWMYRIIYNVCMDEKRKKKRKPDTSGELEVAIATVAERNPEIIPEQKVEHTAEKEEIMAAINELSERYRMALILYYYEDMSYSEIAQTFQVSEQVVANILNRAKEKLRANLKGEGFASFATAGANPNEVESSVSDLVQQEGTKLPVATKAGAVLPALALTQAFAFSEATTVTAGALASVSNAAAAAVMPKGLLLMRLADNVLTKSVTGALCAAALVGAVFFGLPQNSPQPPLSPPLSSVEEGPPAAETPEPPSAKLEGLPEGATTTLIVEGADNDALEDFKMQIENYTSVATLDSDGYHYQAYRNNSDANDYVLTVEELESESIEEPESENIEELEAS